jgi:hypothetical protein
MTYTHAEKHDFVQGLIWSKREWLKSHGGPKSRWPEHEIQRKQDALKHLEAIADDYRKAVERKSA